MGTPNIRVLDGVISTLSPDALISPANMKRMFFPKMVMDYELYQDSIVTHVGGRCIGMEACRLGDTHTIVIEKLPKCFFT